MRKPARKVEFRRIVFLATLFLVWYTWPTEGQEKRKLEHINRTKEVVTISATPRVCLPTCTVRATIIIQRHEENRWLVLFWSDVADVSGFGGQSNIPLDRENAPVEFVRDLKDLPKGAYLIGAQVLRFNGKAAGYKDMMVYVGTTPAER